VLVSDAQAQVYVKPEGSEGSPEEIVGCAYGHKHAYPLGVPPYSSATSAGGVQRETLAGPIVAYAQSALQEASAEWWIVVRDLRNGRVLRRLPTGTINPPKPSVVGIGRAVAIVVKSDGSVAWIVESDYETAEYQVHAVDKTGSRLLATGTNIAPSSLKLTGSTLHWTQGGQPSSAPLQ